MEYRKSACGKMKPALALALALVLLLSACLLLPLVSSVPVSRSVSLGNRQASGASSLEAAPVQGVATTVANERSGGEVVARMDVKVNDYPGSSANGRHEPPRNGRG